MAVPFYDDEDEVYFDPEEEIRLNRQIRENISKFFAKKRYFCGGTVPETLLYSKESVELVLSTPFNQGLYYCQEVLIKQLPVPENTTVMGVDWDVHLVLRLINDAIDCVIPVEQQAGMMMLYFKFCRGCSHATRNEFLEWSEYNSCVA